MTAQARKSSSRSSSGNKKRGSSSGAGRTTKRRSRTSAKRTSPARTPSKRSSSRTSGVGRSNRYISAPSRLPSSSTTFVFECTQQGCGYKIYREEKAEPGQLRFDIKCPKCHNEEFRCMGKGDYPESFETPITSPVEIDFSQNATPVGSGSD